MRAVAEGSFCYILTGQHALRRYETALGFGLQFVGKKIIKSCQFFGRCLFTARRKVAAKQKSIIRGLFNGSNSKGKASFHWLYVRTRSTAEKGCKYKKGLSRGVKIRMRDFIKSRLPFVLKAP